MFKNIFTFTFIILTCFCSLQVYAGADPQYPAADFEPKIQYQSPEAAQFSGSTATSRGADKTNYPAANFKPTIQFQDQELIKKSAQQQASKPAAVVKKIAAAPATPKPASTPVVSVAPDVTADASSSKEVLEETEDAFGAAFFVLLIFAVLLYAFKNKIIENATPHGLGQTHTPVIPSQTGVEKYLAKNKTSSTTNSNAFSARPTAG